MDVIKAIRLLNKEEKSPQNQVDLIKRWRDVYYGISLHTTGACPKFKPLDGKSTVCPPYYFGEEYQNIFENFLFSRHPREAEVTRQWRFSQYRPLTRAPFQQIIDIIVGAIFQDSNYGIVIEDKVDEAFIWENRFEGHDLIGWYANVGIPNIIEDPNGLIVRMPLRPYYEQTGGKIDVGIFFINTKDIVYVTADEVIFFKDDYAFYMDRNVIFRFSKVEGGKWGLTVDDEDGYYAHMLGRLPVDVAGGIWNTQGFYDSYLMKAKAIADDFVSAYSAEQMVDKEASHPFIIMANEECGECQGVGKINQECDDCTEGYELVNCKKCYGRGTISVSPGDRLTAKPEDMKNDLVKIVNPDVGINTYHHDKTNDIYERILHALNLYKTDKAESGEAKAIDQERLYQFISKISNHLFDKPIYNTISDFSAYRNLGVVNGLLRPIQNRFSVQKPTQFQIKTAADLLSEYKAGQEGKLPVFVRGKMVSDFIDKQYSGDNLMKRKSEIILQMDDLATLSSEEKMNARTFGEVSKEDLIFSRKLPAIIDQIVREKGESWIIESDFDTIKIRVMELFSQMNPDPIFNPNDVLLPENT